MDGRRTTEQQRSRDAAAAGDHEVKITVDDVSSFKAAFRMPPKGSEATADHKLSAREMESLVAIVDTFLPSLDAPEGCQDESVASFYATSASMLGVDETAAVYFSGKLQHPLRPLVRVALWFLSTWYGTFAICGWRSMSPQFPFFRSFRQVEPRERREKLLLGLSQSYIWLYRVLFRSLKLLVLIFYFTQVDEKSQNPTWKALGYCGPDPEFVADGNGQAHKQIKKQGGEGEMKEAYDKPNRPTDEKDEKTRYGPLYPYLIHLNRPESVVAAALTRTAGIAFSSSNTTIDKTSTNIALPTICCDAVIVGSGAGGGVVAGVLASAGYKVVVLEKGGYRARRSLTLLERDAMESMYEASGVLATRDARVSFLAGATVGGGTAVNWSGSIRPPETVLREWSGEKGLGLFGSELFREAQDTVCCRMGVQEVVAEHGFGGEVMKVGCEKLGWPVKDVPRNAPPEHSCGWCCFGCKNGMKKGTAETWLVDAVESGNAAVLPGCRAVRVVLEKRRRGKRKVARGVEFEYVDDDGDNNEAPRRRFVVEATVTVVACGALNTPTLLRQSGLRNLHIGRNLRVHPVLMAWGTFPDDDAMPPEPLMRNKNCYAGGIMTAMSTVTSNFDTTGYGALIETPVMHPGMFAAITPWVSGADFKLRMTKYSKTVHVFAMGRDKGPGGTIDFPSRAISYKLSGEDAESLRAGLEAAMRILVAAGAAEIGTQQAQGRSIDVRAAGESEVERFVKEESKRAVSKTGPGLAPVCSAHQMGTCQMGASEKEGVVDERGEAWEAEGLFVADASLFPTAVGVNPMVTVMATAYCTAQAVKERLHRLPKRNDSAGKPCAK